MTIKKELEGGGGVGRVLLSSTMGSRGKGRGLKVAEERWVLVDERMKGMRMRRQ